MELYHIHVLGKHDNLFKNKEIIINKDTYNNELYERVYNSNYAVDTRKYPNTVEAINYYNSLSGFGSIGLYENISLILAGVINNGTPEEKLQALRDASEILHNAAFMKRELSMEAYRKENEPNKPSRLHSFYACDSVGISYWVNQIKGNKKVDVYVIESLEEPFKTNEQLMPLENTSYIESYYASKKYFNPKEKELIGKTNEYLIQGKVKILEKVYEIGNNK